MVRDVPKNYLPWALLIFPVVHLWSWRGFYRSETPRQIWKQALVCKHAVARRERKWNKTVLSLQHKTGSNDLALVMTPDFTWISSTENNNNNKTKPNQNQTELAWELYRTSWEFSLLTHFATLLHLKAEEGSCSNVPLSPMATSAAGKQRQCSSSSMICFPTPGLLQHVFCHEAPKQHCHSTGWRKLNMSHANSPSCISVKHGPWQVNSFYQVEIPHTLYA